jgi:hypothetical protein
VQEREIKEKARTVNSISLDYHLTHAVFACNQMLRDAYKEAERESRRLKEALQTACRKKDEKAQKDALEEIRHVERKVKYYIYVEYVNMPADVNRVIKTESQLIVSLSKKLLENACNKDGSFIGAGLEKLRWVTAHELGHALLHSENMKPGETQGSIELNDAAEAEANLFAEELLRLRHERNEALRKSGVL